MSVLLEFSALPDSLSGAQASVREPGGASRPPERSSDYVGPRSPQRAEAHRGQEYGRGEQRPPDLSRSRVRHPGGDQGETGCDEPERRDASPAECLSQDSPRLIVLLRPTA